VRFQRFGKDGRRIVVIKNHDRFHTATGGEGKTARLVTVDGARDGDNFGERNVRASCRLGRSDRRRVGELGRSNIFSDLAQMTFGSGDRLGEVLAYDVGGEARPSGKVTGIDGLGPGAGDRAETGPMQIGDKITQSSHFVGTIDERSFERVAGRGSSAKKGNMPKSIGGVAMADDGGGSIFGEFDMIGGESGMVAVIAKLANRNKTAAGKGGENVGFAST
jgi:hypothetical protein